MLFTPQYVQRVVQLRKMENFNDPHIFLMFTGLTTDLAPSPLSSLFSSPLPHQSCDGTVSKLRSVFQEIGRIDAVKVIDRCMEDYRAGQQQILGAPGIRRGINTAPG